jgi:hypothetical protein
MSRTNWLSRLTNRSRSQKNIHGRRPAYRRRPLGNVRDWLLEDRCLPSGSALPLAAPTTSTIFVGNNSYQLTTIDDPTQVLFLGGTAKGVDWGTVPQKLLTFTNNSADHQTIYPFLYSPNDTPIYDPIDTNNEEYREYVGYTANGNTYLGLPYGASITINVPLVFWNGSRADIVVSGTDLIPQPPSQDNPNPTNPFQFYYSKNGVNASINIGTQGVVSSTGNNGIVMYYHSHDKGSPNNPSSAALGQLTEWTIRDKSFLTLVTDYDRQHSIGNIPSSELTTLINYDVSYVDDLLAPIAMEATQVPVPIQYIQAGTVTSSVPNGGQTTTTIQLHNDATMAFLVQLLTSKPDGALTMPSWDVLYDVSQTQRIDIGTVTSVDTNTNTVTVVKSGTVSGLPAGQAPFIFDTSDVKDDFGWTGAESSITDLQNTVANFTSNDASKNGLGQYFGGLGWPTFYDPSNSLAKIPGGANIFANSPLTDQRSPYNQFYYLLSSEGAIRIQYGTNGVLNPASQTLTAGSTVTFQVNVSGPNFTAADLAAMKQALENPKLPVPWKVSFNQQVIGTITAIDTSTQIVTVKLSQTIDDLPSGYSLDFQAPVKDPFATKLRDLWYSWANYYVNLPQFQNFIPQDISATVSSDSDSVAGAKDTRILSFSVAHPELALGMTVSGQGIKGLITIEKISSDMKTFYLSAPVPQGLDGQTVKFTFSRPAAIPTYGDPVLITLLNAAGFGNNKAFADLFAASVYETMAVYSTIAKPTIPQLPGSMSLVYECIGGGVGHLPTAAFVKISADVRDLGKSVLRGVPNFTNYPNTYATDAQWQVGDWYPPPSQGTDGQNYNVFNLDPYVWFVHQDLHLSGYGFSFDDDASDIGAGGTSSLSVSYAGLGGLPKSDEWFASTPWGVVHSKDATISQYSGTDPTLQTKTMVALQQSWAGIIAFNKIRPDDLANSLLGAYIDGKGIINNPATNNFTRVERLLGSDELTFVMSQAPSVVNLPYKADLTFTGSPPQGANAVATSMLLAAGTGAGQQPLVNVFDAASGQPMASFDVFDPRFLGGVRVAVGDVNGDGVADVIIAAGPGGGPEVRIIDGTKLTMVDANGEIDDAAVLASFYAYDPRFSGGVFVAFGVSAGGRPEIITGADAGGGPHVKVIDATKLNQLLPNSQIADSALVGQFYAYDPSFSGGVRVAAADLNSDGVLDIVTGAGPGGGPHVKAIDGSKLGQLLPNSQIADSALIGQFYAYTPSLSPGGGVYVAASNIGGHPIIITGDGPRLAGSPSDGPLVKVIDATKLNVLDSNSEPTGAALLGNLMAYDPAFSGGVTVGALDVNGDNAVEIITGQGSGAGPAVQVVDGTQLGNLLGNQEIATSALLDDFYAFASGFSGGVYVGAGA